ncbi:hypothetical protein JXK06_00505 [Patescibacteria group bacterium]|nr:hypothetical protein [Patescibacteria group bacterium]
MNKKVIFLISLSVFLGIILIIIFFGPKREPEETSQINYSDQQKFLSEERKAYFGLAPETEVEVLADDEGYEIYQIIRDTEKTD